MSRSIVLRYVNPWRFRREQKAQRLAALRSRDGDNCTRCRRPLRFDLPAGHDLGARIEAIRPETPALPQALDDLCLTHRRCHSNGVDATEEVLERLRPKREAALFEKARGERRRA